MLCIGWVLRVGNYGLYAENCSLYVIISVLRDLCSLYWVGINCVGLGCVAWVPGPGFRFETSRVGFGIGPGFGRGAGIGLG